MELREFAEQVLFASSLDLKLSCPASLTDEHPGRAWRTPAQPGRPAGLVFRSGSTRSDLPSAHQLEKDEVRGKLLHFFANHELLATELMALVLLKFPDAPKSFRRGVLKTLKDEQEHTRIYLERLRELGVEFGQHPVNGFFWKVIAPMETPLSYVSRLSLTFEQANLDYSGYFARQFNQIGDTPTERILERIHRDEIGHVGYGLKWFRRWKDPHLSDWEAFQKELSFPLSPSRAKAVPFNAEARRKAGLDAEFVNELFVYSKSKGRTPDIFVFNPLAESLMGERRKAKTQLKALTRDLATLPQFLSRGDDVVLVPRKPRTEFLAELKQLGFDLPQFEVLEKGALTADAELRERRIGRLRPWAWSPDVFELLQPLMGNLTTDALPAGPAWRQQFKMLFSKAWAADCLREYLESRPDQPWLSNEFHAGTLVMDYQSALETIHRIRSRGHLRLVGKCLYGSSGHHMLRFWEPELLDAQKNWLRRILEREGALIIEPWLERVLDFSQQFEMESTGLRWLGSVKMINDARGQFRASVITPRFTHGLDREITQFIHRDSRDRCQELSLELAAFLEPKLSNAGFQGPVGVDSMIFRNAAGQLQFKPIVEINPRFTLGRVALELARHICPGKSCMLELVGLSAIEKQGFSNFAEYARYLKSRFPVQLAGQPKPRISTGAICLNDPEVTENCLAVLLVAHKPTDFPPWV